MTDDSIPQNGRNGALGNKTLSSSLTFFLKFIFPPLWIIGFGGLSLWQWQATGASRNLPIALIGMIFILWATLRLKRVVADDNALYVSDYFKEASIPLAQIADVVLNRYMRPNTVTIYFSRPTEFGDKIVFIPKSLNVVEEIQQLKLALVLARQ